MRLLPTSQLRQQLAERGLLMEGDEEDGRQLLVARLENCVYFEGQDVPDILLELARKKVSDVAKNRC